MTITQRAEEHVTLAITVSGAGRGVTDQVLSLPESAFADKRRWKQYRPHVEKMIDGVRETHLAAPRLPPTARGTGEHDGTDDGVRFRFHGGPLDGQTRLINSGMLNVLRRAHGGRMFLPGVDGNRPGDPTAPHYLLQEDEAGGLFTFQNGDDA